MVILWPWILTDHCGEIFTCLLMEATGANEMGAGEELTRSWYSEVWNAHKSDADRMKAALRLGDESVIFHRVGPSNEDVVGVSAFLKFQRTLLNAFPDMTITLNAVIESGDSVAVRWTSTMTHTGEWMGRKPTGKRLTITGMGFSRIGGNGKAIEGWDEWDRYGLLQQIDGATP
jgi:predicted ester cyclase